MRDLEVIKQKFEEFHSDHYGKFNLINNNKSSCEDVNGLMILSQLFSDNRFMIASCDNNVLYLNLMEYQICELSDDNIKDLLKCRITYNDEANNLSLNI